MVSHDLAKFGSIKYCSNRDMFLVCHVIKQDRVIKGSSVYNDRSPSVQVSTLPSLVVICTLVVEIKWF